MYRLSKLPYNQKFSYKRVFLAYRGLTKVLICLRESISNRMLEHWFFCCCLCLAVIFGETREGLSSESDSGDGIRKWDRGDGPRLAARFLLLSSISLRGV